MGGGAVGTVKSNAADRRFSKMVRERARYCCQRCKCQHATNSSGLHCAHIFSRRAKATRHDPDNALALCYGCHSWAHRHEPEFRAWVREEILGPERFDALEARYRTIGKRVARTP